MVHTYGHPACIETVMVACLTALAASLRGFVPNNMPAYAGRHGYKLCKLRQSTVLMSYMYVECGMLATQQILKRGPPMESVALSRPVFFEGVQASCARGGLVGLSVHSRQRIPWPGRSRPCSRLWVRTRRPEQNWGVQSSALQAWRSCKASGMK